MPNRFQTLLQRLVGVQQQKAPRTSVIPKKTAALPFTPTLSYQGEPPPIGSYKMLQSNRSWVYACVTKKAQEFAMIDLVLYKRLPDGSVEEVKSHEALDVLDRANDHMTRYDLFEATGMFLELTGECFWWKVRNQQGKVVQIYPWLSPAQMSVIPSPDDFVSGYLYTTPQGQQVPFVSDDVIQFKYLNPENPYRGLSPLKAAEYAVATDTEAARWNWRFFRNQARPGGVIETEGTLTQEQYDRAIKQWESGYQGTENAHRIAIIEGGAKFRADVMTQKDMDFTEQRRASRDEILAIYKVPKTVLGLTEDVNRASAEATKAVFLEEVIFPMFHKFVGYLNEFYLPEWNDDTLFFDFANQAPREVDKLIAYYQEGLRDGWLAPNEVREAEGYAAFDGGDQIFAPFTAQTIGTIPATNKNARPRTKRWRRTEGQIIKQLVEEELKNKLDTVQKSLEAPKEEVKFPNSALKTYKARDTYSAKRLSQIDKTERRWKLTLQDLFKKQKQQVLSSVEEKAAKTSVRFQFDAKDELRVFTKTFTPLLKELIAREGERALQLIGKNDFSISTENVQDYITGRGLEFAKQVNDTTQEEIKQAINDGLEEGEGISQIKDRVSAVFDRASDARAFTIARTEVNRSANFAQLEGFKQSDVVEKVEWLTAGDERVDLEICEPMDGEVVDLGEAWELPDGTKAEVPQDAHPNCRCTALPVLK